MLNDECNLSFVIPFVIQHPSFAIVMTEANARKVANLVVVAAAVGVALAIVRRPPLRRLAIGLAASALTGTIPTWLTRELQTAWTASGRRAL
jgi:hypothetical protein